MEKMKENEEIMINMVKYLDSLLTIINLDLDKPVPNSHFYQK